MTGAEERGNKELIYYAAVSVLRRIYESGTTSLEVLEKANELNAQKMNCRAVDLLEYKRVE